MYICIDKYTVFFDYQQYLKAEARCELQISRKFLGLVKKQTTLLGPCCTLQQPQTFFIFLQEEMRRYKYTKD